MFTLRRVYLDEIESGGTTTIQSFKLQDINKNYVTRLTFEPPGELPEYVYAVLTPSDTTVPISWSEPSGIVSINGQGSAKQTAIITPKKVGSSTVSATLQSTVSILPPETFTVTVKGKLENPTLKSNDTATIMKNPDGSYTWKRADGKTHSATLTLDTGFLVDARDIEVTVANGTTGAVVTCGSITPAGGLGPTISVPLSWTEGDTGTVKVTVSGKTTEYWVTPSFVSVTINLESKPAEVTNLSLTTSGTGSSISNTAVNAYLWNRTDNDPHEATLTFDTGIEMLPQDIDVQSSNDAGISCGTVSVSGTTARVKLTYKNGNSGDITITIKLKGVTNKEIKITIKGINDSGTTFKPTPSGYR